MKAAVKTAVKTLSKKSAPPRPHGGAGEVRIIGGQWKRTSLPVPDLPGLRPTPARVRETLFNWLGQDLAGWRCIDAFAGSGALGLECASRGAAQVLLCEQDLRLAAALKALCTRLSASTVEVRRGDGISALRAVPGAWDLVLLDPPFEADLFDAALKAAAAGLAANGLVYLEAPEAWDQARLAELGWSSERHLRAGAVHAHLLRRSA
ncbi:16S rRNA (guanine(966)-N(2))-methyltransferase RsmD [Xylophilus rhododendri]|uniref:16S rRNA (Guanine(966)-N(2))-methyltransferase RsmD n=1 Tax=Xylophilus rhododendri TaxID=2697032 RepID=A0A857J6G8_9BURK|nr:16S rRNA (guanine(966)-N(2))-methyltransferase RsmD [Xylophilus rhododendri]